MATQCCPTCGQPLPVGLSRANLDAKLKEDRDRASRATLDRERQKIETQLMAKLVPRAKAEAKRELRVEAEEVRVRERREAERVIAAERQRRQRAEQTTDQLKR